MEELDAAPAAAAAAVPPPGLPPRAAGSVTPPPVILPAVNTGPPPAGEGAPVAAPRVAAPRVAAPQVAAPQVAAPRANAGVRARTAAGDRAQANAAATNIGPPVRFEPNVNGQRGQCTRNPDQVDVIDRMDQNMQQSLDGLLQLTATFQPPAIQRRPPAGESREEHCLSIHAVEDDQGGSNGHVRCGGAHKAPPTKVFGIDEE